MDNWQESRSRMPRSSVKYLGNESLFSQISLQLVDFSLTGVLFVAPLFFGGRHDLGKFVLILLAVVGALGVSLHRILSPTHTLSSSFSSLHILGIGAILLVVLQVVPLGQDWLTTLAPRNLSLLPLWDRSSNAAVQLGSWNTLSLTPSSTKLALSVLIAFVLIFATTAERLQKVADIERMLRMIAVSCILMCCFGLLQYCFSNGLFFWFYEHPFTTTFHEIKGSFTSRNHFAHFIALGTGPMLSWLMLVWVRKNEYSSHANSRTPSWIKRLAVLIVANLLVAITVLSTLSRGGTIAWAVVVTVTLAIFLQRKFLSSTALYALALLALLVVGVLSLNNYQEVAAKLDDFTAGSLEELDSNNGRRNIWEANFAASKNGFLFGSGAGSHREIYPIYLKDPHNREYTHAENGYLQIATENGVIGILLLISAILLICVWCWKACKTSGTDKEQILAIGATASLSASFIHSIVDFVWFIPACMSVTLMLAACILRLAQLRRIKRRSHHAVASWTKPRMYAVTTSIVAASCWAITTAYEPAAASLQLDRYLLTSLETKEESLKLLTLENSSPDLLNSQKMSTTAMISQLEKILEKNPESARSHLRLATRYLTKFNQVQLTSANPMSIDQIRDAVLDSNFANAEELNQWLFRAFGENTNRLYLAHYHTRHALQLCPLQGKGYLHLANLCFLEGYLPNAADAYLNQALRVRPNDGDVVFEVGRQCLLDQDPHRALLLWQKVYHAPGIHQVKIINLLAGQVPVEYFLENFKPDWHTLRQLWQRYQTLGVPEDLQVLAQYASSAAVQDSPSLVPEQAAYVWNYLSRMYTQLGNQEAALKYLEYSFESCPHKFWVRRAFGQKLYEAKRFREAQTHLRWCLMRQPDNKNIQDELLEIAKWLDTQRIGTTKIGIKTTPNFQ